ncbi:MAG: hypothetical protein JXL81_01370, partial [Deltaproteobacteria bacterium]|nr:hypothetical protein [Deltaproteobacteria bacterium]
MQVFKYQKTKFDNIKSLLILLFFILFLTGCNSGGGGDEGEDETDPPGTGQTYEPGEWEMHEIKHIDAEGLLIPQV